MKTIHRIKNQSSEALEQSYKISDLCLRTSKIPARYVHGTIDVPKDRFNNWVGQFDNINAGVTYAASGGIPITPINEVLVGSSGDTILNYALYYNS